MENDLCRQALKGLNDKMDDIALDAKTAKALLLGNGKMGTAEMARRAFNASENCRKTKNGRLDWIFRIIVAIMLGYIAVEIGIK